MGEQAMPTGEPPVPDDASFTATILGGAPDLSAMDLADRLGTPVEVVLRLWRVMGFPVAEPDEAIEQFVRVLSSALHAGTAPSVLARALAELEAMSADEVARGDGRVIKHIGDEVMFTTNDAATGGRAALAITAAVAAHPVLTQMRAALSFGEVVPQGGEVYGETVNVAARATHLVEPGQVLVTAAARDEAAADDLDFRTVGVHHLRDVGEVELFEVRKA